MSQILTKPFWNDYHRHPICLLPKRYEINHWQEALAVAALVTTVVMAVLVVLLAIGVLGGGSLDVVAASIGIAAGIPLFITIFVGVGKDTTPPKNNDSDSDTDSDVSSAESDNSAEPLYRKNSRKTDDSNRGALSNKKRFHQSHFSD